MSTRSYIESSMRNAWLSPSRKKSSVEDSTHQDRTLHTAQDVCPEVKMTLPHSCNAHPTYIRQKKPVLRVSPQK